MIIKDTTFADALFRLPGCTSISVDLEVVPLLRDSLI